VEFSTTVNRCTERSTQAIRQPNRMARVFRFSWCRSSKGRQRQWYNKMGDVQAYERAL
jgi:hypothetical protein